MGNPPKRGCGDASMLIKARRLVNRLNPEKKCELEDES